MTFVRTTYVSIFVFVVLTSLDDSALCGPQDSQPPDAAKRALGMQKRLNRELFGLGLREGFRNRLDKSGIAFGTFLNDGWNGSVERVGVPGLRTEIHQECGGKIRGYLSEGRPLTLPGAAEDPTTGYSVVEIEMSCYTARASAGLRRDFQEMHEHRLFMHESRKKPDTPVDINESRLQFENKWNGPGENESVLFMSMPHGATAEVTFIHKKWLMRASVHRSIIRNGDPNQAERLEQAKSELLRYTDEMLGIAKRVEELATEPEAVIFLPGICGSWLKESEGTLIWPLGLKLVQQYEKLRMRPDGSPVFDIRPDGLLRKEKHHLLPRGPLDFYGAFFKSLESHGYYEGVTLHTFDYDWRLSNSAHFNALDALVSRAAETSSTKKVTLIAHSMGGLIARSYVLSNSTSATSVPCVPIMSETVQQFRMCAGR